MQQQSSRGFWNVMHGLVPGAHGRTTVPVTERPARRPSEAEAYLGDAPDLVDLERRLATMERGAAPFQIWRIASLPRLPYLFRRPPEQRT